MTQVPQSWTDALGHLRAALVERDVLRSPGVTVQAKDLAMARYARSVDAMVASMERLSEDRVLARITLLLSVREQR